jgi:hypothetical protein
LPLPFGGGFCFALGARGVTEADTAFARIAGRAAGRSPPRLCRLRGRSVERRPEFARHHVEWMDGRLGSSQQPLPFDEVPVPDILNRLPYLHEQRPRGSKAMINAAGARARLHEVRPGAWPISPFTGWKWGKWPSGDVGWLPSDVKLPPCLRVPARNDVQ